MENPITKAQARDEGLTEKRVAWACRSDSVWKHNYDEHEAMKAEISALRELVVELVDVVESANSKGRLHRMLVKYGISR